MVCSITFNLLIFNVLYDNIDYKLISLADQPKKEKLDLIVYFNKNRGKIIEFIGRKAILKAAGKLLYRDEKLLKKIKRNLR